MRIIGSSAMSRDVLWRVSGPALGWRNRLSLRSGPATSLLALAEGRRGDAVALFMRFAGTPAEQVARLRRAPFWPGMEAVAPTLAYDHAAILGEPWSVPAELAARVSVPALVMAGDASLPFMPDAARVLSRAIPQGQLRTLEGQTHEVNPGVLASVLVEFFTS